MDSTSDSPPAAPLPSQTSASDAIIEAPSLDQLQEFANPHGLKNKLLRVLWGWVWLLLFRPSPRLLFGWRAMLLRLFGARIEHGAHIYSKVKFWAPWNLTMGPRSTLADDVDCYCVAPITLEAGATVSQYSFLCSASHDITDPAGALVTAPIVIKAGAWIFADVFIGPGVTIGEGAVVGARSSVYRDVEPWTVVGGNPARFIKKRELKKTAGAEEAKG